MTNYKLIRISSILTIIGCFLFIILTTIAMLTYPGGTFANNSLDKYNFLENFFSDLGLITAHNGENNIVSRVLFTTALTLVGLVVLFYFIILPPIFKEKKSTKWLSLFGSFNGVVCAFGYIGVAFVPLDLNGVLHSTFVYMSFSAILVALILYVIAIFLTETFSNFFAIIYIILGAILLGYLVILYGHNFIAALDHEIVQVLGQKIVVYSEIVTFLIQGIGTLILTQKEKAIIASL
ncbi:MAG: hypothetical protein FK733_12670 [Asgard group archaeon]|nr:hypothetical protein [Asgard group archaeon]